MFVQRKRKGVLDCVDLPFSIKRCCANGVGVSLMKGILFGERSLVASSEKTLGVGVLAISVVVLGLGCGRKSEKNGPSLSKIPLLPLEMGEELAFGRMSGVVRRRSFVFPNLFRLTSQKNARVADLWDWDSGIVMKGAPEARLKLRRHHSR